MKGDTHDRTARQLGGGDISMMSRRLCLMFAQLALLALGHIGTAGAPERGCVPAVLAMKNERHQYLACGPLMLRIPPAGWGADSSFPEGWTLSPGVGPPYALTVSLSQATSQAGSSLAQVRAYLRSTLRSTKALQTTEATVRLPLGTAAELNIRTAQSIVREYGVAYHGRGYVIKESATLGYARLNNNEMSLLVRRAVFNKNDFAEAYAASYSPPWKYQLPTKARRTRALIVEVTAMTFNTAAHEWEADLTVNGPKTRGIEITNVSLVVQHPVSGASLEIEPVDEYTAMGGNLRHGAFRLKPPVAPVSWFGSLFGYFVTGQSAALKITYTYRGETGSVTLPALQLPTATP